MEELVKIQTTLKAPKNQHNSFGKYNYRSCESILEAVKPLLAEQGCFILLTDTIMPVANRVYVEATATIINKEGKSVSVKAYAREAETKTGMDAAQVTGAASSYARKYALNGLFAIDDTKDPDTDDYIKTNEKEKPETQTQPSAAQPSKTSRVINDALLDNRERLDKMLSVLDEAYRKNPANFAVIKHLRDDLGFEFENHAEERVMEIWMQHIEELN